MSFHQVSHVAGDFQMVASNPGSLAVQRQKVIKKLANPWISKLFSRCFLLLPCYRAEQKSIWCLWVSSEEDSGCKSVRNLPVWTLMWTILFVFIFSQNISQRFSLSQCVYTCPIYRATPRACQLSGFEAGKKSLEASVDIIIEVNL